IRAVAPSFPLPKPGLVWLMMLFSVAICVLYYRILGYNLLMAALSGANLDYTTMRLDIHTTGEMTGIVNQFKNTMLPVCFFAIGLHYYEQRRYSVLAAFGLIGFPVLLYCIAGTGQRGYLIFALAMVAIYFLNGVR